MLDKVVLFIPQGAFSVNKGHALTIQGGSYDNAKKQWVNEFTLWEGMKGAKAYVNTEHANISVNGYGVNVRFNPAIAFFGENKGNIESVSESEFGVVSDMIEREILSSGIDADIKQAAVSRIDLQKTAHSKRDFATYSNVFRIMSATRLHARDYGETYTFMNTQREVSFYNKLHAAMQSKNVYIAATAHALHERGEHRMRCELRMKNKTVVEKCTGIRSFGDLRSNGAFDMLAKVYRDEVKNTVFKGADVTSHQTVFDFDMEVSKLLQLRKAYPKSYVDRWYMSLVMANPLLKDGGIDTVERVFTKAGVHRNVILREKKKIIEMMKYSVQSELTPIVLLNELNGMFLQAA